jgi:two-component system NtrC family response regulator
MFQTLIVDDNAAFRAFLNEILVARFPTMRVVQAEDASQASRTIDALDLDLVFMDVKLPDGNGLDLVREIKADHCDTVVIVVTGYDLPEYRVAARESGASFFLSKSSTTEGEILSVVESVVLRPGLH